MATMPIFMFTVTLDKAASAPVTVAYSTANGTATAGADYVASGGTVTFAAGETSKMVHVDIKGDVLAEGNETFTVNLSNPAGAKIADGTAIGTIIDDDGAPVLPALSIADLSVAEGNGDHAHFMFHRDARQGRLGARDGGLFHRQRHGNCRLGLRGHQRHPHLRGGRNHEDGACGYQR